MFGYVRPLVPHLRVCDHEVYKGMYCGLCHALKRGYGITSRFLVNYDLCFLALLVWDGPLCLVKRRCMAHPFRKRGLCAVPNDDAVPSALALAADATVLVSIWKLEDNRRDGGFLSRLAALCILRLFRHARRKAEAALPEAAETARSAMERLWALEDTDCDSLDAAADCFAELLAVLSLSLADDTRRRVAHSLLYQLGRWIYLTDAADDLPRDLKQGAYNPFVRRFALRTGWTEEALRQTRATLSFSRQSVLQAASLWPENVCTPLWKNILEEGLTFKEEQVLGQFDKTGAKP